MKKIVGFIGSWGVLALTAVELAICTASITGYDFYAENIYVYGSILMAIYAAVCLCSALGGQYGNEKVRSGACAVLCLASTARMMLLLFSAEVIFTVVVNAVCIALSVFAVKRASIGEKFAFSQTVTNCFAGVCALVCVILWCTTIFFPKAAPVDTAVACDPSGYCATLSATRVMGGKYELSASVAESTPDLGLGYFSRSRFSDKVYSETVPIEEYVFPELVWSDGKLYIGGELCFGQE